MTETTKRWRVTVWVLIQPQTGKYLVQYNRSAKRCEWTDDIAVAKTFRLDEKAYEYQKNIGLQDKTQVEYRLAYKTYECSKLCGTWELYRSFTQDPGKVVTEEQAKQKAIDELKSEIAIVEQLYHEE